MISHPAKYYGKQEDKIKCLLCPHACILSEGKTGLCKTRFNQCHELYTKAWGNLCSLSIDPIEKKPLFHFLPGSDTLSVAIEGCTFHCLNCQNFSISQYGPGINTRFNILPDELVELAISKNCESISYTYSEPIAFYEYMLETARLAKEKGIKNVMVSNGYINTEPLIELCKYIDAANIDLKAFDNSMHRKLTSGSLQPVLDSLKTIKEKNVWLEITNLIIPDWTDNMQSIQEMCKWLVENDFSEVPVHFSRFQPMYKMDNEAHTPSETILKAVDIALKEGIKYVYAGNMRGNSRENTFCPTCLNTLIYRNGFEVVKNEMTNGICNTCFSKISGIWQ